MSNLQLTLGTVTFQSLELPETIGPLGGIQSEAHHDFAGGYRSIQTFGAFPEPISFRGILTGSTAFARSLQIDRLRSAAQQIPLFYGAFAYLGIVTRYHARPRYQWFIPYEIEFLPMQDLSGSLLSLLSQGGLAPELAIAQQLGILGSLNTATNGYLELPSSMQSPVQALITGTGSSLLASGGSVSALSPANSGLIIAGASAVVASAGPYIAGTNPILSSPALDAASSAQAISNIVSTAGTSSSVTINTINPNLLTLAAQYYGDQSQWRTIANANSLTDPQPIGSYTLTIPRPAP